MFHPDLARHPATASHLALKLARHFIADQPPPGLVKELAQVYRDSDGDLAAVCDALVTAPEAFSAPMRKIRLPQEFVVAAQRATGIRFNPGLLLGACNTLGQPLWQPGGPNGFDDGSAAWATGVTGAAVTSALLVAGGGPGMGSDGGSFSAEGPWIWPPMIAVARALSSMPRNSA